uniref:RING-type domain-containing protein n=1 Tax=Fundulus heteroclitus TaxID=8078 RepID=A0A3Q2NXY5_FUNHE
LAVIRIFPNSHLENSSLGSGMKLKSPVLGTCLPRDFLSCHVCSETFRDPVSLSCNHSFCSSCLQKFWEQAGNKNCPVCKRKSSKDLLTENFGLKELSDLFAGRKKSEPAEKEKGEKPLMVICSKNPEDPVLLGKDEQKAVCPVCQESLLKSHKVVPVEQISFTRQTYFDKTKTNTKVTQQEYE